MAFPYAWQLYSKVSPKRNENIRSHRNLHVNFYSSVIHNSQKVEMTRCPPTDEWINKMSLMRRMEYYLAIKWGGVIQSTNR